MTEQLTGPAPQIKKSHRRKSRKILKNGEQYLQI